MSPIFQLVINFYPKNATIPTRTFAMTIKIGKNVKREFKKLMQVRGGDISNLQAVTPEVPRKRRPRPAPKAGFEYFDIH